MGETNIDFTLYERLMKSSRVQKSKVPVQPHKHLAALHKDVVNPENLDLLDANDIELTPSEWLILGSDPKELEKNILRGKELGFFDAYLQNPSFLKPDANVIVQRMANLEHLGIPYKNEKGKYQSFLFSARGYAYVVEKATGMKLEADDYDTSLIDDIEIREAADRVIETFALESEQEEIYKRLGEVGKAGLSTKEILMEVFKAYGDNLDYLSSCIDEILSANEEVELGRAA